MKSDIKLVKDLKYFINTEKVIISKGTVLKLQSFDNQTITIRPDHLLLIGKNEYDAYNYISLSPPHNIVNELYFVEIANGLVIHVNDLFIFDYFDVILSETMLEFKTKLILAYVTGLTSRTDINIDDVNLLAIEKSTEMIKHLCNKV